MKNLILLFALLLSINLLSQVEEVPEAVEEYEYDVDRADVEPTTIEEYNYLTKGYAVTLASGLDFKAGYELREMNFYQEGSYTFDFKLLIRSESEDVAAIFVIANSLDWGNTYYLCIPIENLYLMGKYNEKLRAWDK